MVATEKLIITFRLDASHKKGMGHLYRMKTLAGEFRAHGADCRFLLRRNDIAETILDKAAYPYTSYPVEYSEDEILSRYCSTHDRPDLWIFDLLGTESVWVDRIKSQGIPVVCFDDLHSGMAEADLVINAIVGCWGDRRQGTHILNGPRYAILPPDILTPRSPRISLNDMLSVGVTLGGSDTHGATLKIAQVLAEIKDIQVTFFLGPHFLHDEELQQQFPQLSCRYVFKKAVRNLHHELAEADIVICGGGQTLFELCAMGKPVLAVANESHEEHTIVYFSQHGACMNIGSIRKTIEAETCYRFFERAKVASEMLRQMSIKAQRLVDGKGTARCYQECLKVLQEKREKLC